ncbi:MAG: hypothetical protein IIZ13_00695 [Renibacterium sp.]|nr:hypothetical protein [Renibacterium sp.]
MSLIDPSAAARERAARKRGPLPLLVSGALLIGFGGFAGYGWSEFAAGGFDAAPEVLSLVAIPLGMTGSIISFIAWSAMSLRRERFNVGLGLGLILLGFGSVFLWTASSAEAARSDTSVLWIVGSAALAVAALLILLSVLGSVRRAGRGRLEEQIMRNGRETVAAVSDQGYVRFRESANILTTVTFTFHDAEGRQRWVRRSMLISENAPVLNGQKTRLWYDPMEPGNEKKIVVEMARSSKVFSRAPGTQA